jgi:tetratricopeptide (TPR) repeat protein
MRQSGRLIFLGAVMLLLSACSALTERRDAPADIGEAQGEVVQPDRSGRTPPAAPSERSASETPAPDAPVREEPAAMPAHEALAAEARAARAAGDHGRAIALLERAQRIEPGNGALYLELARSHRAAGNDAQARATAERGLLYCRGSDCRALQGLISP